MEQFIDYSGLEERLGKAWSNEARRLAESRRQRNLASMATFMSDILASKESNGMPLPLGSRLPVDYSGRIARTLLLANKREAK